MQMGQWEEEKRVDWQMKNNFVEKASCSAKNGKLDMMSNIWKWQTAVDDDDV